MSDDPKTSEELDVALRTMLSIHDAARTIDAERAGGTGKAAPPRGLGAAPKTVDEAIEHVGRVLGWRTVLGQLDQAALALLREVKQLRFDAGESYKAERDEAIRQHQATLASSREYLAEIDRLKAEMAANRELAERQVSAWRHAYRETAKLLAAHRAALPEIIGCPYGAPYGDPERCNRDEHGWHSCCRARLTSIRLGLLPACENVSNEVAT